MENSLENARTVLQNEDGSQTSKYKSYIKYKDAYEMCVKEQNDAYKNALTDSKKMQMWSSEGKLYQDNVSHATDEWNIFGYKQEIENAIMILT